jgi:hypothetical protein
LLDQLAVLLIVTAVHAAARQIDDGLGPFEGEGPWATGFAIPFEEHSIAAPALAAAGDGDDLLAVAGEVTAKVAAKESIGPENHDDGIHSRKFFVTFVDSDLSENFEKLDEIFLT